MRACSSERGSAGEEDAMSRRIVDPEKEAGMRDRLTTIPRLGPKPISQDALGAEIFWSIIPTTSNILDFVPFSLPPLDELLQLRSVCARGVRVYS